MQGVAGCFHDAAAREYFSGSPAVTTTGFNTFPELFRAVSADNSLLGIVAIENTIAGSILSNYELLRQSGLVIKGEYKKRISHVLCALPGQSIESVIEVNSHPMALMQCEQWLRRHPHMKIVEHFDTAGSAMEIARDHLTGHAAVCGEYAATLYGLEILARSIETNKHNFTRFLIIGAQQQEDATQNADKASLMFTLPHSQGALSRVLAILSFYDLNLSKIQSTPIIGREWEYRFYIDLTFDDMQRYRQALDAVRPLTSNLRVLGEYRDCPPPQA